MKPRLKTVLIWTLLIVLFVVLLVKFISYPELTINLALILECEAQTRAKLTIMTGDDE